MKLQVLNAYGLESRFELQELPKPEVRPGQVVVRVVASGVNPADVIAKQLGTALDFAPLLPAVFGMDFSGIVESVGAGVEHLRSGDSVFGCAGGVLGLQGSLAEYMAVDARLIAKAPTKLDLRSAAALPLVSITAWEGIFDKGQVKPGEMVLIHGGGGGVGSIAVQLAKMAGAYVVATERTDRLDLARSSGADVVVNADSESFPAEIEGLTDSGFDVVFDTIGGEHLAKSFLHARRGGKVVTTIGFATVDLAAMHSRALSLHLIYMLLPMMTGQGREEHGRILERISNLTDRGLIRPHIDKNSFSLAEANEAYLFSSSGKGRGKTVIDIECK